MLQRGLALCAAVPCHCQPPSPSLASPWSWVQAGRAAGAGAGTPCNAVPGSTARSPGHLARQVAQQPPALLQPEGERAAEPAGAGMYHTGPQLVWSVPRLPLLALQDGDMGHVWGWGQAGGGQRLLAVALYWQQCVTRRQPIASPSLWHRGMLQHQPGSAWAVSLNGTRHQAAGLCAPTAAPVQLLPACGVLGMTGPPRNILCWAASWVLHPKNAAHAFSKGDCVDSDTVQGPGHHLLRSWASTGGSPNSAHSLHAPLGGDCACSLSAAPWHDLMSSLGSVWGGTGGAGGFTEVTVLSGMQRDYCLTHHSQAPPLPLRPC